MYWVVKGAQRSQYNSPSERRKWAEFGVTVTRRSNTQTSALEYARRSRNLPEILLPFEMYSAYHLSDDFP